MIQGDRAGVFRSTLHSAFGSGVTNCPTLVHGSTCAFRMIEYVIVEMATDLTSGWATSIGHITTKEQFDASIKPFNDYRVSVAIMVGMLQGIQVSECDVRRFYSLDGTCIFNDLYTAALYVQRDIERNEFMKQSMHALYGDLAHICATIYRLRLQPLPAGDAPPAGPTVAAARLDIRGAPFVQGNIMHF